MTLLFFPDWTNGLPSDFLILHFFVGAVIFPFNMIHAKARKIDSQNPQEAANGDPGFSKLRPVTRPVTGRSSAPDPPPPLTVAVVGEL